MTYKIGLIARYALEILRVTSKYSQKLHKKCVRKRENDLKGNRQYVLNANFKQVCEKLSLAVR